MVSLKLILVAGQALLCWTPTYTHFESYFVATNAVCFEVNEELINSQCMEDKIGFVEDFKE